MTITNAIQGASMIFNISKEKHSIENIGKRFIELCTERRKIGYENTYIVFLGRRNSNVLYKKLFKDLFVVPSKKEYEESNYKGNYMGFEIYENEDYILSKHTKQL